MKNSEGRGTRIDLVPRKAGRERSRRGGSVDGAELQWREKYEKEIWNSCMVYGSSFDDRCDRLRRHVCEKYVRRIL